MALYTSQLQCRVPGAIDDATVSLDSPSVYGAEEGFSTATTPTAREGNLKVVVRVRPPLLREQKGRRPFENTVLIDPSEKTITVSESLRSVSDDQSSTTYDTGLVYATYRYTFDTVYSPQRGQQDVYDNTAREAVLSTLQGYNAAIIAYGQTGTGKTYTMDGELEGPGRGIIPRAIEDIFKHIENDSAAHSKFLVRASYFQIYNEVISDLLKPEQTNLMIREGHRRGVYVEGLSEWVVRSPSEVHQLMQRGAAQRTTGVTKMNETSSRSHAVFTVITEKSAMADDAEVEQFCGLGPGMSTTSSLASAADAARTIRAGKLNLVDLAGSERVHITGATGKRLEESKKINASLSTLGNVISALTDGRGSRGHIPYRNSKLTRFLEDSLGGNCKTTIIATISPALEAFAESLSTLKFANRAKRIRNQATINEDGDQRTLLRKYERELKRLRTELQQRQVDLVDKRQLLAVEEERRRAEADRLAAITALEARSKEILAEKEAKRRLEARIAGLQSQLLLGGHKVEETPAFRKMLAKEQQRIRAEYEKRFRELEKEREGPGSNKLERCTALLLKQREIMLALTARLKRRDDQILNLQQELEAFDQHQKHLEDELDHRTAEIISLRRANAEGPRGAGRASNDENAPHASEPLARGPTEVDLAASGRSLSRQDTGDASLRATTSEPVSMSAEDASEGNSDHSNRLARLKEENIKLLEQLRLQGADRERLTPEANGDAAVVTEQCRQLLKERVALKTILEGKMKYLLEASVRSLQPKEDTVVHVPEVVTQLAALQKLVAATVKAMEAT